MITDLYSLIDGRLVEPNTLVTPTIQRVAQMRIDVLVELHESTWDTSVEGRAHTQRHDGLGVTVDETASVFEYAADNLDRAWQFRSLDFGERGQTRSRRPG